MSKMNGNSPGKNLEDTKTPRWLPGFLGSLAVLMVAGCAGRGAPVTTPATAAQQAQGESKAPSQGETQPTPTAEAPLPGDPVTSGTEAQEIQGANPSDSAEAGEQPKLSLRDLCHIPKTGEKEPFLDASRRRLQQTFCGATLWVDGLLGGRPDPDNARAVSGRLEIAAVQSEYEGFEPRVRLRLKYDLPTLDRRLSVFLGRDDREEVVQDRKQGIPIRSEVFGLETEDSWLAGLGYRPPGKYLQRLDFSVGGQLKTAPEVFVKGRWQRNFFLGERSVLRLQDTVFWENRDGFGSTLRVGIDRVISQGNLVRWSNVGTVSEESDGLEWGSTILFYQHLGETSAFAYETFIRGATDHEVKFRELGFRGVYRRSVWRRWFYGELITGFSWPREHANEPRKGSVLFGVGVELLFGKNPY